MASNNITLNITAETGKAVVNINQVVQKIEQLQGKGSALKQHVLPQLAAGFTAVTSAVGIVAMSLGKVSGAVMSTVTAYSAQEIAERRLQTTLRATQNAVGMSAGEMLDLADALSQVSTYSDQEILAVEQMLAATRKISAEVMPEATQAILDMAAATGEDAVNAAQRLSQALADPAGEIESLKEAGIQLSEEQKENIKRVQEQNGVYEAQKILLKEVESTYGGMARAIADTDTGKLQQISNVWQDIKEGLGEGLLNSIGPALDALYEKLLDIDDWISRANLKEDALNPDTDLSGYSIESLNEAAAAIKKDLDGFFGSWWLTDPKWIEERESALERIYEEIEARGGLASGTSGSWLDAVPSGESKTGTDSGNEGTEPPMLIPSAVADFIKQNGRLSESFQIDGINKQIQEAQELMQGMDPGSDSYKYLEEITSELEKQREALQNAGEEAIDYAGVIKEAFTSLGETVISSVFEGIINGFQTMADEAEKELEDIRDKWDEYFDDLDEKQDRQAESLSAMLASGNISYEDYINAMNDMDETRAEAKAEAEKEEEEAKKKADELNKAAFDAEKANSIADATISGAMSIAKIWADYGSNPILAGVLTGISAASIAAQIGVISSQKYTSALAAGGIVTAPTTALIGEGGSPEAVLPLNEGNMERFGLGGNNGGGVIYITVNVGASYSGEDLAENVFRGIERAQRTGALPRWRYA